ncbi:MAG: type I polyketide synthase, partial [Spirochaetia bacterium]|nr:type I polyketide synthase [Spirochaetia bacterium]
MNTVKNYLKEKVAKTLQVSSNQVDDKSSFMEMGLDSTTVLELTNSIQDEKGIELYPTLLFEYTHLDTLAAYLLKEYPSQFSGSTSGTQARTASAPTPTAPAAAIPVASYSPSHSVQPQVHGLNSPGVREKDIAVIGMSGRFPQSKNLGEFWENLKAGKNLITEVPASRWDWKKFYGNPETESNKTNCKHGGFVDEVDQFDPLFFGISPREAIYMDPQQRLFIESVWEAIEDSGYKASSFAGRKIGLFAGVSTFDYTFQLHQDMEHVDASIGTGVAHSTLVNRISYLLDLRGPSEAVDTACSSALVALHHAMRSIWYGDAELAIAGGVNISSSPIKYITFSRAGMLSPDGQCKTFDKDANGYVPGEGVGAVLLKPLSAAIRDKD